MSMIILCDSTFDLRRFGMRRVINYKISNLSSILQKLKLKTDSWSCDTFGSLCDYCFNTIVNEGDAFDVTALYFFLKEIIPYCKKIALFYISPLADRSKWIVCDNRDDFFRNVEIAIRNDYIGVTILYNNADFANDDDDV